MAQGITEENVNNKVYLAITVTWNFDIDYTWQCIFIVLTISFFLHINTILEKLCIIGKLHQMWFAYWLPLRLEHFFMCNTVAPGF